MRVVEYNDPRHYADRVGRWMVIREAENCYILGILPELIANAGNPNIPRTRMFAVQDGEHVLAAAVLFPNGCLAMTWASQEMKVALAQGLLQTKCRLTSVFGPGHIAWHFAKLWAEHTGQAFEFDRTERVYQLARPTYELPPGGRLELATTADSALLTQWLEDFGHTVKYEYTNIAEIRDSLLAGRQLFLWKNPHPVSMVAWVSPTPNGGCINFVYTPPALRRQGHAAAAITALARHMLSNGRRFCFIMTDPSDNGSNAIYQKIGARTLCELLRCMIVPAPAVPVPPPQWQGAFV